MKAVRVVSEDSTETGQAIREQADADAAWPRAEGQALDGCVQLVAGGNASDLL